MAPLDQVPQKKILKKCVSLFFFFYSLFRILNGLMKTWRSKEKRSVIHSKLIFIFSETSMIIGHLKEGSCHEKILKKRKAESKHFRKDKFKKMKYAKLLVTSLLLKWLYYLDFF